MDNKFVFDEVFFLVLLVSVGLGMWLSGVDKLGRDLDICGFLVYVKGIGDVS